MFTGEGSNPRFSIPNESQTSCTLNHRHIQLLLLKFLTGPRSFLGAIARLQSTKGWSATWLVSRTHCLVQTSLAAREKFQTNIMALRYTLGVEIGNISPQIAKNPRISRLGKGSLHVANEKVFLSFFVSRSDWWKIYLKALGVYICSTVHPPRSSVRTASAWYVPPKISTFWSRGRKLK